MTYELSVLFTFETKKMGISFIPTFALPKNPIYTNETTTVTFPNKTSTSTTIDDTYYSELYLSNVFYGQLNLYLNFKNEKIRYFNLLAFCWVCIC